MSANATEEDIDYKVNRKAWIKRSGEGTKLSRPDCLNLGRRRVEPLPPLSLLKLLTH